jgi:hypothetical protein
MRLSHALALIALACNSEGEPKSTPLTPDKPDPVTIELLPVGPDPVETETFSQALDARPEVIAEGKGHRVRQLRFELLPDPATGDPISSRFIAVYYDYDDNRAFSVQGDMSAPATLTLAPSPEQLPPSLDEREEARRIALADPQIAADHAAGRIELFDAMPPTIDNEAGHRMIALGIRPTNTTETGEIAGVDLTTRQLVHLPGNRPSNSKVGGFVCNPPPYANQGGPGRGTPGWARVRLVQSGVEIWSMLVRRPSSSGGTSGSGVELGDVRYMGKTMLSRANVPILNVLYDGNACGPYRDWQYEENPFTIGNTLAQLGPGIRVVDWAKTMRETRDDTGNFTGVALYWDDVHQQAVIISELTAGWYRYMSEWRFGLDGTITPRWGFDAVQNWCTCQTHTHHAYWRLDLQLGNGANQFEQIDDASAAWAPINTEGKRTRDDAAGRHWRVRDPATGDSVLIRPSGPEDAPDAYGIADAWFLAAHPNEVDDAGQPTPYPTAAGLDAFLNNESVANQDVVLWWGGHFVHNDANPAGNQTHTVQLTLTPETW